MNNMMFKFKNTTNSCYLLRKSVDFSFTIRQNYTTYIFSPK